VPAATGQRGEARPGHGELARRGERAASPVSPPGSSPGSGQRRSRQPREAKPVSRLATLLGGLSFAAGLTAFTLGFIPGGWGLFLAAGPLVFSTLTAWGSFARSKFRAARISAMAVAGVALSALHVVMLFVR
jgi:hypothetical protein